MFAHAVEQAAENVDGVDARARESWIIMRAAPLAADWSRSV
jgi:hypothetical protein